MKIAIVILNWNGKSLLQQFLPSVLEHSLGADIYVADNASSDASVAFVREAFPQVKIIENSVNGGYAKGYNWALAQVEADVFCLLNSDIEVTEHWLAPVRKMFAENPEIGAVQPKILDYKSKNKFEYAGAAGGFLDKFGFPYCRGRIFYTIEEDNGQYDSEIDVFWATGACFFVRAGVFRATGGFDEDFFAHQEEIDLCWRIHLQKKRIVYCPDTVVYHVGGATLPTESPQKVYLNFRNGLYMLLKNLPKKQLFGVLFVRLSLDGVAAIRYMLGGKFSFLAAIFRAHVDFYKRMSYFYKKRSDVAFSPYYNLRSIVGEYFIKGRKKYSELKVLRS